MPSRRQFVQTLGATAAATAASRHLPTAFAQPPRSRVLTSKYKSLAEVALAEARRLQCDYADIRFTRSREHVFAAVSGFGLADGSPIERGETSGFGVRVLAAGSLGFASAKQPTADEIRRVVGLAVARARRPPRPASPVTLAPEPVHVEYWATPIARDPFAVAPDTVMALLHPIADAMLKTNGIVRAQAEVAFTHDWRYLATLEGSFLEQETWRVSPSCVAIARAGRRFGSRRYVAAARAGGYEVLEQADLAGNAERVAAEAVERCGAAPLTPGTFDLIIAPSHAALLVRTLLGVTTEADRVLGDSPDARSPFTPADVGRLVVGPATLNVSGDRTIPNGLAGAAYDDDGVRTRRFAIVREGRLVGLQTTRDTALRLRDRESHGCASAASWRVAPLPRSADVSIDPGPSGSPTPDEMIADTKNGLLLDGAGLCTVEADGRHGLFGADCAWHVRDGKKVAMVGEASYRAAVLDFFSSLDAMSGEASWEAHSGGSSVKGSPAQAATASHGSPWLRIRNVAVSRTHPSES